MRPIGPAQTTSLYWCEVWQASADVAHWTLVRADSVKCDAPDCGGWLWEDQPFTHRAPAVTLDELKRETEYDALQVESLPFDTSTVTAGSATNSLAGGDWRFAPSSRSPRCGLAFRLLESDRNVVSGPFYFVDLERRAKAVLSTERVDDMGWSETLAAEHCGMWLIPGTVGNSLVVDCGSGRVVFSQPPSETFGAAWLPPPRR
jgi:hypothetical protein